MKLLAHVCIDLRCESWVHQKRTSKIIWASLYILATQQYQSTIVECDITVWQGEGKFAPSQVLAYHRIFLLLKIFMQKFKFGGIFRAKMKFWAPKSPVLKICICLSENCKFVPPPLLFYFTVPLQRGVNVICVQACYGIQNIPEGNWLCRTCALNIQPRCLLCPKTGGAMKSTEWVSCSLFSQSG